MRLAVFSDVHGNLAALTAVLERMRGEGAEGYLFLGDLCGYFPEALACWRAMRGLGNLVAVLGNHDRMFLDIRDGDEALRVRYRERYGLAMEQLLADGGGAEVAQWLRGLPQRAALENGTVLAVHGSPEDPLKGYVYPDSPLPPATSLGPGVRRVLMGHTHYRMQRSQGGVDYLNPGSAGQPRDGGWPSYGVLDTVSGEWAVRQAPYDREATRQAVRRAGDDTLYLARVLERMGGG